MNDFENKNELLTEGNVYLNHTNVNTLCNNQKKLPLIFLDKEKKYSLENLNTISPSSPLTNKDAKLINFYKSIHSKNKPMDSFPNNFDKKRFIILNIDTQSKNDYLNDNKDKIIAINAMEMINMELTGIQFHALFNIEKDDNNNENNNIDICNSDNNNNCDNFYNYLAKYYNGREDNNKKLLQQLLIFIGKSVIICHNALYIIKLINKELTKNNLSEIPINRCICTLRTTRYKNYLHSKEKLHGYKIYDLCKNYDINIDEKILNNCLINTFALCLCVIKMFQEELSDNKLNINKKSIKKKVNILIKDLTENHFETEQREEPFKSGEVELQNDIEPIMSQKKIMKLDNKSSNNYNLINSPYNYSIIHNAKVLSKTNINNSPNNNGNTIFNIIENNNKEFNKKYRIAKSYNKYKFIWDKSNKTNIFTLINGKNKKFLMNNFTNNNSLIKKNIFSDSHMLDINKIQMDETN